jgi:leucyl/phenylalanyl-tRNA---protein transferase
MFLPASSPSFPSAEQADAYGVVHVGGKLTPEWLLEGYRRGVFPWPDPDLPWLLPWCSPDPRGILELNELHVSRRLRDTLRSNRFTSTIDAAFAEVVRGCATVRRGQTGTWITDEILAAYCRLHDLGYAHSVEVWREGRLVGGIYGVGLGGYFSGESMFHRESDASKVALVRLVEHLASRRYQLFDIQQVTPHTARMGAREIRRSEFLARLGSALSVPVSFHATREADAA